MAGRTYTINAEWDAEGQSWMMTSDEIPGLVLWGSDPSEMTEKLRLVIPGLIETGVEPDDQFHVTFRVGEATLPGGAEQPEAFSAPLLEAA